MAQTPNMPRTQVTICGAPKAIAMPMMAPIHQPHEIRFAMAMPPSTMMKMIGDRREPGENVRLERVAHRSGKARSTCASAKSGDRAKNNGERGEDKFEATAKRERHACIPSCDVVRKRISARVNSPHRERNARNAAKPTFKALMDRERFSFEHEERPRRSATLAETRRFQQERCRIEISQGQGVLEFWPSAATRTVDPDIEHHRTAFDVHTSRSSARDCALRRHNRA